MALHLCFIIFRKLSNCMEVHLGLFHFIKELLNPHNVWNSMLTNKKEWLGNFILNNQKAQNVLVLDEADSNGVPKNVNRTKYTSQFRSNINLVDPFKLINCNVKKQWGEDKFYISTGFAIIVRFWLVRLHFLWNLNTKK